MAKVLLIEDEKAMSDLIAVKFKVDGFEVEQAFTLAEAKAKIASNGPFGAILTDYLLPDGDTMDFLVALRESPTTQTLPVIVMTNYVEDLNVEKLKSLGVSDILVKYQVVPAQMVEKIKALIGTSAPAAAAPQPQASEVPASPVPPVPPAPGEPHEDGSV